MIFLDLRKNFWTVFVFIWISSVSSSDKDDFNTCSFNYWRMDWRTAVRTCEKDNKELLCYRSKKEIEDITEAFRLTADGEAELEIWLSSKNCSQNNTRHEECLSLHIRKSAKRVWHYFQENCHRQFPFICCVRNTGRGTSPTADSTPYFTTVETTGESEDEARTSAVTSSQHSSTTAASGCSPTRRRRITWPYTASRSWAVQKCPGNSIGTATWFCEADGKWNVRGPNLRNCRSLDIRNWKGQFNHSSLHESLTQLEGMLSEQESDIYGDDLADVILTMTTLPERLVTVAALETSDSERWLQIKSMVSRCTSVYDRIMELNTSWWDIKEMNKPTIGSQLLSTVDGIGIVLGDAMTYDVSEQSVIGKNLALQAIRSVPGQSLFLPQWSITSEYSHQGTILLESGYDRNLNASQGNVSVVFTLYTDLTMMLTQQQQTQNNTHRQPSLNSAVVSAVVSQGRNPVSINGSSVKIVMEHLVPRPNDTACVFWNLYSNEWDTQGCRLVSGNDTYSVCVCDHLTNFAILMDYKGLLDDVDQQPFFYITVIGCSISIVCLAICVAVFSCYSYHSNHSWGMRYVIHRNLCLTLLIANFVLVVGMDKTDNPDLCAVVAGMLHYFFLSAFSWMLLEGVHIYLLLVVVFAARRSHAEKFYLFGYGFPIIVVGVTALVRPTYYGTDEACWLSNEKGTIWAFMGPVAAILLLNAAALGLAQWKASNISAKSDNVVLFKRWLRVTFILFPVLGITWVFGFLHIGRHFQVAGYLFAIFNSLQGFCIFICHCVLDQKARTMVLASLKKKTASVTTGSSGTQRRQRPAKHSSSSSCSAKADQQQRGSSESEANGTAKILPLTFKEACRKNWNKWQKPWSFCFEMPVSPVENGSPKTNQMAPPKPVVIQWNISKDRTT